MIWVKICGTTNLEDARAAVEAGADALGFIFAPSPRRISPKDAKKIIAELPKEVEKVGVFVNQKPEIIFDTVETAGLTGVQLHGDESLAFAEGLIHKEKRGKQFQVIPVIPFARIFRMLGSGGPVLVKIPQDIDTVLIDSAQAGKRGGTGEAWNWEVGKAWVTAFGEDRHVIMAGGLNAKNVGEAIRKVKPWGVDVASGVEKAPGKKDHDKVRAFVKAAKAAAQS